MDNRHRSVGAKPAGATVSVQIVTYNSAQHIAACLEAVGKQTYPVAQIVIVDNGSTDATRDLLKPYAQQACVVLNAQNRGYAAAHNQALELTDSAYCLVLNPDVVIEPDYIAVLVESMGQAPNIGSACGKLLLQSNPEQVDSAGLEITKARRAFDRESGCKDAGGGSEASEVEVFGVSGAAAMYARAMIADIQMDGQFFDEAFFAYKEDVDVAWRARLFGWSAIYAPRAIAYHERGWKLGGRQKQPLFIRRCSYINRYRMILKNDRLSCLIRHFPQWFIYELISTTYILLREPKLLTAWGKLFRDLPALKRQRAQIQRRSKNSKAQIQPFFR